MRATISVVILLFLQPAYSAPREAIFSNGDVQLAGTLVLPEGDGPHPVIVFVHGSGPHPRQGPLEYAPVFTDLGYGLLAFDKRGSGESTGSWVTSSLDDLASDVAAAVDWLRGQADVSADRIGLWGISQAGWIIPQVMADDPRIAFAIVVSGGGASPLQSELYSYHRTFEKAGLPASVQADAFATLGDYFWYLATGRDREALVTRLEAAREQPWYEHAPLERILPSESNRPNWAWVATYDPLPAISRIKAPVLLLFGDQDDQQPTELAVERWRQGLQLAGNTDATIRVFAGADHGLRQTGTDHHRGPLVEGYQATVEAWLRERR